MELSMHSLQPLLIDVCVNLRRRNVGVPEHLLNDSQIGAVAEQMRSEAVPQRLPILLMVRTLQEGSSIVTIRFSRRK